MGHRSLRSRIQDDVLQVTEVTDTQLHRPPLVTWFRRIPVRVAPLTGGSGGTAGVSPLRSPHSPAMGTSEANEQRKSPPPSEPRTNWSGLSWLKASAVSPASESARPDRRPAVRGSWSAISWNLPHRPHTHAAAAATWSQAAHSQQQLQPGHSCTGRTLTAAATWSQLYRPHTHSSCNLVTAVQAAHSQQLQPGHSCTGRTLTAVRTWSHSPHTHNS